MIGKILADRWGWTEKLGGTENATVKITTKVNKDELKILKKDIQDCNTTAQVDVVIEEHGLSDIEGLPQHIKELYEKGEISSLKGSDVNNFITQQNYKNIANAAHGFKGVNTAIKEYNNLTDTASKSKLAETISTTNTSLGKYLTGLKGAKAGLGSYAGSLVTATAKTFALQAATMAMNAAISMGISFLVSTAISAIASWADNVIHAAEKAKEAAEEAKSAIDDIKSDFDTLSSTTNDVKERFAELAQEVENLGKVNQSRGTLSTDDYDEFLDLSNQLAELFPQLKKGCDDNGNAILDLSGNVDTIVGSLNNLVLVQQKIANQQILEEMPKIWAGYTSDLDEYTKDLEDSEAQASSYQTALEKLSVSGDGKITVTDSALHQSLLAAAKKIGLDEGKWYQDNLSSFYNETWDYSGTGAGASEFKSAEWDFSSLTKAQIDQLKNALAALGSEYEKAVKSSKNKIDSANSDMTDYIGTWLSGEWNYAQMDADMQNVARDVLFNTDWVSQLPDDVDASDWDDVSSWLQENFLYAINEIDNAEIQTALVDAFNGSLSIEDLQYLISQLTGVEGFDQKNPLIIYLKTKLTDAKTLQKQKDDVIQFTKDKFDGYDPTTFFEENSIDTQEEVDKWLEIAKSANSAADAEKKYLESLESDAASNVKQSIADKWNSLIDTDDEELKNTREDLLALAKAGQLTEETFYDTTGADTFLKSINENISETIKWINQLVSSSTQLESMSAQISKMSDMLADKKNGTTASASDLAGFDATVKGLESWEEFERTLGSSKSTMEECQAAANKLATEWVNNGNFLSNLTEENKQYYITQLANMGIENATAIVTETLTARKIAEKYAINDLTNATIDEIKVKYQEIAALVEEGKVSETTASALYDLIYQQTIFSNQKLDVYGKISALQELALAFGVTADAALGASQAINLENQLRLAKHYGATDAQVDAYAGQLTSKMQDAIKAQFGGISTTISSSGSGDYKTSNSGGGSGSSAKSETKELFDWIEKRIDKLKSRYDKWLNQAERAVNTTRIATYYKLAQKNLEKLLNTEAKAYNYYKKKAESVGLSEKYASKVRNGTLNIETITDEKLIDKINDYQQWYEKMVEMSESFISDTETLYNIPLDKAADKIEKFSDAIDLLDKKIDNAIGYKDKNKLLTREARNEKRIYKSYVAAQKATQKNLDTAGADLTLTKTLKNSGLTAKEKSAVKKAVKKGKEVDLSYFTEGTDAYVAAEKYNEALRANTQATSDLKNATEDYETVLREISKAKFDNVAEQFENVIGHIDNALDDLSNSISDIKNRGLLADATLYEAQIDVHNKILAKLESEHTKLKNQLQNIKEQTTEWYEALEAIQDVENSIAETNASIKEMRDAITEIASTLNDNIVDSFHTINDESDLLLTLLGDNLTDSDIGGFTDEGIAALALYSNQLNVAKTTAEKLLSEINSVQDAVKNGTYDDFVDANGMNMQFASAYEAEAYIEELYAKYRDEINSTYTYESNIIDLMKEKYAAEIDYIKELIDQKKGLLDAEKDLYEYSKNIKEQIDNIDSLRKQIAALSGDTSLETSARIQKLQSQLKDAQEELSDTEYERYISDQQDMLDNLYAEYEELVTSLEKDTDALLQEGLQLITQNSAGIQETIRSVASDNNYQMTSIMDSNISDIVNIPLHFFFTKSLSSLLQ